MLTKKRLRVIDEALDATKVTRVTWDGKVTETFDDVDHKMRLAAGSDLDELIGLKQSKSANDKGPTGPVQVNVIIEAAPEPVRVRAEVIDA